MPVTLQLSPSLLEDSTWGIKACTTVQTEWCGSLQILCRVAFSSLHHFESDKEVAADAVRHLLEALIFGCLWAAENNMYGCKLSVNAYISTTQKSLGQWTTVIGALLKLINQGTTCLWSRDLLGISSLFITLKSFSSTFRFLWVPPQKCKKQPM